MQVLLRNARAAAAGRKAAEADSSEHCTSGSGLDGDSSSTSSSTSSSASNTDSAAKEGDAVNASLMTKESSGGVYVSTRRQCCLT